MKSISTCGISVLSNGIKIEIVNWKGNYPSLLYKKVIIGDLSEKKIKKKIIRKLKKYDVEMTCINGSYHVKKAYDLCRSFKNFYFIHGVIRDDKEGAILVEKIDKVDFLMYRASFFNAKVSLLRRPIDISETTPLAVIAKELFLM